MGKAKTTETIDVDNESDEMSALSTMTKDNLIAALRKARISSSKKKGSAPKAKGSQSHSSYSEDSHSDSGSPADSSSSSSDEESEEEIGTDSG